MRHTNRTHPEDLMIVDVFQESVLTLAVVLIFALMFALLRALS